MYGDRAKGASVHGNERRTGQSRRFTTLIPERGEKAINGRDTGARTEARRQSLRGEIHSNGERGGERKKLKKRRKIRESEKGCSWREWRRYLETLNLKIRRRRTSLRGHSGARSVEEQFNFGNEN